MPHTDSNAGTAYAPDHSLELVPSPKRIRVMVAGRFIVDSRRVLLRERGRVPVYYFPLADLAQGVLQPSERTGHCARKGPLRYWHVQAAGQSLVAQSALRNSFNFGCVAKVRVTRRRAHGRPPARSA